MSFDNSKNMGTGPQGKTLGVSPPLKIIDNFRGEFFFLSNFSRHGFTVNGIYYKTNEHFFQAHKVKSYSDPDFMYIVNAETPRLAKQYGSKVSIRSDWMDIRIDVMDYGLFMKFTQNRNLLQLLLKTGDADLVEGNTWNDTFWGVCNGVGENHLGKLLMSLRCEFTAFFNSRCFDVFCST